jgi:hypothetical protein
LLFVSFKYKVSRSILIATGSFTFPASLKSFPVLTPTNRTMINPTNQTKEVDLGGEYEKIIGSQDPKVNDGTISDRVKINGNDGLIMLKTFQSIKNVVFKNGSFLRFFRAKGQRARNGFFVFEEGIPGGSRAYVGDITADGQEDKIIAGNGKVVLANTKGEEVWSSYPYGDKFKGELNVAVGRLHFSDSPSIVVSSPLQGSVVIYNYLGQKVKEIFPVDKKFKGGLSVAVGNVDADEDGELVIGIGKGKLGEVLIYNATGDMLKKRFSPYGKYYNGLEVAVGDFQGDGTKEIVTLSKNPTPLISTFDASGKKLTEFRDKGVLGTRKFFLTAFDVNNDAKEEIVVMNE